MSGVRFGVGMVLINGFGGLLALSIALIAGRGPSTDVFFLAFAIYAPLATLGFSLRNSLIPLLAGEDEDRAGLAGTSNEQILGRTLLLGLSIGAAGVLASGPLAHLVAPQQTALAWAIMLCLFVAAAFQIAAGVGAAGLATAGLFGRAISVYVVGNALGLIVSISLLAALGVIGAAIGILSGAFLVAVGQVRSLARHGMHPEVNSRWVADGRQVRLLAAVAAGVSMGLAQQVGLAIALGAAGVEVGGTTDYAYAYYIVGFLLNVSVLPLAIVTLPTLAATVGSEFRGAVEMFTRKAYGSMAFVLTPLLAIFIAYGEPVLAALLGSSIGSEAVEEIVMLGRILTACMGFIAISTLALNIIVARKRWSTASMLAIGSIAAHTVLIVGLSDSVTTVALAHTFAAGVVAAASLAAAFWTQPRTLALIPPAILPALGLAGLTIMLPAILVGTDSTPLSAVLAAGSGLALYGILAKLFWPSIATPVLLSIKAAGSRATRV